MKEGGNESWGWNSMVLCLPNMHKTWIQSTEQQISKKIRNKRHKRLVKTANHQNQVLSEVCISIKDILRPHQTNTGSIHNQAPSTCLPGNHQSIINH